MQQIIEDLYKLGRHALGSGYDSALIYIDQLIPLDILEYKSGTKVGTWVIPDEWVVHDAWLKHNGKKILDYKKDRLSLVIGSLPFEGKVDRETLLTHMHYSDVLVDAFPYEQRLYEKDWGFTMPKDRVYHKVEGKNEFLLPEGEYEVCIKTEYKPGTMKIGVHTIKGKTDKEVLLFAHLDHAWQANNNLSGVAALIDMVTHIKPGDLEHTIKLIFCPATIGSVTYALMQDTSKVSFMMALESCGTLNKDGILLNNAFDKTARVNHCAHLAMRQMADGFRHAPFRSSIGSEEYAFNDPQIGIPGLMLSTHPYPQHNTSADTPEIINYEVLAKVQRAVINTIKYYEQDYIPRPKFKGPLFRSGFGVQSQGRETNMAWDYFFYNLGTKPLSELCVQFGLNFEHTKDQLDKLGDTIERGTIVGEGAL